MSQRILLIDDDQELCQELTEMLNAQGYQTQTALDGWAAHECLMKKKYDIVLLDYKMPGLNGLEILHLIKTQKIKTRVFLASGRPFVEKLLVEANLADVVSGYLPKPYNPQLLLEQIKPK